MITGFRTCSSKGAYRAYALPSVLSRPRPRICARTGRWRQHAIHALASAHAMDVGARMLSVPSRSRPGSPSVCARVLHPFVCHLRLVPEHPCVPTHAHARSHMRPELFSFVPTPPPWTATSYCPPPHTARCHVLRLQ
jgi:hypothetical protein